MYEFNFYLILYVKWVDFSKFANSDGETSYATAIVMLINNRSIIFYLYVNLLINFISIFMNMEQNSIRMQYS